MSTPGSFEFVRDASFKLTPFQQASQEHYEDTSLCRGGRSLTGRAIANYKELAGNLAWLRAALRLARLGPNGQCLLIKPM